jgi:hypothetical protein
VGRTHLAKVPFWGDAEHPTGAVAFSRNWDTGPVLRAFSVPSQGAMDVVTGGAVQCTCCLNCQIIDLQQYVILDVFPFALSVDEYGPGLWG